MKTLSFIGNNNSENVITVVLFYAWFIVQILKKKVLVIDIGSPASEILSIRRNEEKNLNMIKSFKHDCLECNAIGNGCDDKLKRYTKPLAKPILYDIIDIQGSASEYSTEELFRIDDEIWKIIEKKGDNYDYAIINVPDGFRENSPAWRLIRSRAIDLTAILLDVTDPTSIKESLEAGQAILRENMHAVSFLTGMTRDSVSDHIPYEAYEQMAKSIASIQPVPVLKGIMDIGNIDLNEIKPRNPEYDYYGYSTILWEINEMGPLEDLDLFFDITRHLDSVNV